MKVVAVLLTFVAFASADRLVGQSKCTWGPSYWCSHISKAEECGAVDHCVQSVWTKQKYPESSDPKCVLCEIFLNVTRMYLEQAPVRKMVEDYAKEICNFGSKIPEMKKECDEFLPFLPTVLNLLADKNMTSSAICNIVFKDCAPGVTVQKESEKETNELVASKPSLLKTQKICTDCEAFVGDIRDLLTDNNTEAQVIMMLKQLGCSNFGQLEAICDQLVDQYVPQFLSMAASYVDPDTVCLSLGFCTVEEGEDARMKFFLKHPIYFKSLIYITTHFGKNLKSALTGILGCLECGTCEAAVGGLRYLAEDQNVENSIMNFLEKEICDRLGDSAAKCKTSVQQNAPVFFRILFQSLDPAYLCSDLKICPSPSVQSKKVGTVECDVCTDTLKEVEQFLQSPDIQNAIQTALDNGCNLLPTEYRTECKELVSDYLQQLLALLTKEFSPELICQTLRLCPAQSVKSQTKVPVKSKTSASELCVLCEFVMKELDSLLSENSTQAEIEAALDEVCSLLPSTVKEECDSFVEQYAPAILALILQEVTPKELCTALGLCTSLKSESPHLLHVKLNKIPLTPVGTIKLKETAKESSEFCTLCHMVVTELDNMLTKQSTEEEIKAALEQVCNRLPNNLVTECNRMVSQYEPLLLEVLVKELDATVVCSFIGLCPKVMSVLQDHFHQPPPLHTPSINRYVSSKLKNEECTLCTLVVSEAKKVITDKSSEAEIKAALEKGCSILPDAIAKEECKSLIEQYSDLIIQLLIKDVTANEICKSIGLCASLKIKASKDECLACEELLLYLQQALKENKTVAYLELAMKNGCNLLSSSVLQQECRSLVAEYGTQFAIFLSRELQPNKLCEKFLGCTSSKIGVKDMLKDTVQNVKDTLENSDTKLYFRKGLIGANKCHNPFYVCASERNAEHCRVNYGIRCKRNRRMRRIIEGF